MKRTIIHPPIIPVTINKCDEPEREKKNLRKKDRIRLEIQTDVFVEPKTGVKIIYPVTDKDYIVTGVVVRCDKENGHYNLVVEFVDTNNITRVRMVEQICRIELYKRQVLNNEARSITKTQAALEWIDKYAKDFMV
ncbi:hypothetical protein ACFL6O_02005 [candidate division KSB1 bacterium]